VAEYRFETENEWVLLYNTFLHNNYEEFFPGITNPENQDFMKEIYKKAFVSVVTRCFGWGLPKTMIVPFADCINHHNVDSTYEMIHTKYHRAFLNPSRSEERGPAAYYTKSKMDMDFGDLESDLTPKLPNVQKMWPNRSINQAKKAYLRDVLMEEYSLDLLSQEQNRQIWDVEYISTSDDEDNDSEEDEESEDESKGE